MKKHFELGIRKHRALLYAVAALGLMLFVLAPPAHAQAGAYTSSGGSGVPITTVAALSASAAKGSLAVVTDGSTATSCTVGGGANIVTCQFSGSVWASLSAPPILGFSAYGLSVPKVTGLGLTTGYGDSGTYAVTDTALGVNFADTVNIGPVIEGSLTAYPGVPFTYTAVFSVMPQANLSIGLCAAASATAASECVYEHGSGTVQPFSTDIEDWSAPATYSATVVGTQIKFIGGPYLWMRYQDNGTNITYSISEEGINWNTVYTVAKTADYLNANGGFHFFGVNISTDAGPGGTIMLGQKMTTP